MQPIERAEPSFRRTMLIAAFCLALLYLVFSAVFSQLAPLGGWNNEIFGQAAWSEWDPGGAYVDSAHQLVWGDGQLFEGHPGTLLVLLLSALQHAYYALVGSGSGFSYTEFIARNLPSVFVLSKLMMTVLHLISCLVVYLLARRVTRNEGSAAFAAFGYATSLPVGYYLSRISVEPLVVICFSLSVLAVWRNQDLALENRLRPAFLFAGLSGAITIAGALTKLNFLAPLVPFLALYILLGGWGEKNPSLVSPRIRGLGLLAYLFAALSAGLILSQLIDWASYFELWFHLAQPNPKSFPLVNTLPGFTPGRIFLLCELGYVVLGLVGFIGHLRSKPRLAMRALWLAAFGLWCLLLFGYRISSIGSFLPFHYFHLTNVVVAIFFGTAMTLGLRRLDLPNTGWQKATIGLLAILVVHSVMFWTVLDSRRRDAELYAPNREIHRIISQLEPGQELGCSACRKLIHYDPAAWFPKLYPLSSVGWTSKMSANVRSRLAIEFSSIFRLTTRARMNPSAENVRVKALRTTFFVLDPLDEERRRKNQ